MHDQHSPTPTEPRSTIPTSACLLLAAACLAGAGLVLLSYLDAQQLFTPPRVLGSTLAATLALSGCGFVVQLAAERVMQRLDLIEAQVSAQRVMYLPQATKGPSVRHMPAGREKPRNESRTGLTPEAIAAARALARRIADGEDPSGARDAR